MNDKVMKCISDEDTRHMAETRILASPRQIRFLEARGFQHVEVWNFEEAKYMIDRIAANGWRVPGNINPSEYVGV